MEKQTRVQKYKQLRDEMKEEVAINRQMNDITPEEDDDFLAFLPKEEKKNIEDTLLEPLSYETLDKDNQVKQALNEAKVNVGKEQFNTRLDILNRIKQEEREEKVYQKTIVEDKKEDNNEVKPKMSLLEKLAAMSPEEDVEELKKYEEEKTKEDAKDLKKEIKQTKTKIEKPKIEKVIEKDIEEEHDQEDSRLVKILNYVIVVFIIIFLALIGFIVKQMFF